MALEEAAAETVAEGGRPVVRVFRWAPSTLSLGYRQAPGTVDWSYCEREGIAVTRRATGGGGIYHDTHGDVSYSVIAPAEALPTSLAESYEMLCEPLLGALADLGVDAGFADEPAPTLHEPACYLRALNPAHDVAVDGRKISGNAQYRQREAVIQHGSLTYARAVDAHLGCFAADLDPDRFCERVTSVRAESGADRAETVAALESALGEWADAEAAGWTDAELSRAHEIADAKYATDAWTRDREAPEA